jgi:hypothetical protein
VFTSLDGPNFHFRKGPYDINALTAIDRSLMLR